MTAILDRPTATVTTPHTVLDAPVLDPAFIANIWGDTSWLYRTIASGDTTVFAVTLIERFFHGDLRFTVVSAPTERGVYVRWDKRSYKGADHRSGYVRILFA